MKDTILAGVSYWSEYQPDRRIDFNGFFVASDGGVLVDPMPLDDDRLALVKERGGAAAIVLTNFDHLRAASELKERLGARVHAPTGDRDRFGDHAGLVDAWFGAGDVLPGGFACYELRGGKSPVEAALYHEEGAALLFGDVVRSHVSGELRLLPDEKLSDRALLVQDLQALGRLRVRAVLLGDGDCVFAGAQTVWGSFLSGLTSG
jgi:hypothetical protein